MHISNYFDIFPFCIFLLHFRRLLRRFVQVPSDRVRMTQAELIRHLHDAGLVLSEAEVGRFGKINTAWLVIWSITLW